MSFQVSHRSVDQHLFTVKEGAPWESSPSLKKNAAPLLEVQELSKNFENHPLWKDVSFSLQAGETVSICGASGSGKSTLLLAIGGLETVQSGTILFQGKPVKGGKQASIEGMGFIFQHYHLIEELTVHENLRYPFWVQHGRQEKSPREEEMIQTLGLGHLLNRLPNLLSGGEQQRVVIARTLLTQPKLLLADEPTGSLDEATGARVMELLLESCRKFHTSLLLVTHATAFAAQTDRHMVLKEGKLYES